MHKILLLSVIVAPLAGCDSQVDSDHQGTPLARLSGTIRNTRTLPVGDAEVVAAWVNSSVDPDVWTADSVQVTGNFPSQFKLSIFTAPDTLYLNADPDGVKFGVATIVAAKAGTDFSDKETDKTDAILGIETEHLLVYVPADIPANSLTSLLLHGTPKAGFHLYGVKRLTDDEQAATQDCIDGLGDDPTIYEIYSQCGGKPSFDWLVPLASDLQTPLEIELVDDPSTIDAPNWT